MHSFSGYVCLPPHIWQQVRNHILARWRADVSRWLGEEDAGAKIMPKYQHLVSIAWRFLTTHGFINFGVAPAITRRASYEHKETVIVIGAGLAGAAIDCIWQDSLLLQYGTVYLVAILMQTAKLHWQGAGVADSMPHCVVTALACRFICCTSAAEHGVQGAGT